MASIQRAQVLLEELGLGRFGAVLAVEQAVPQRVVEAFLSRSCR